MNTKLRYFFGILLVLAAIFFSGLSLVNGMTITVTDAPPRMAKYPANVKSMTDAEFYQWAVKRNAKATSDWQQKYDAAGSPYVHGSTVVQTNNYESRSTGTSSVSMMGATQGPGKMYGSATSQTRVQPYRHANPDFVHPGPLTIINPYVRPK